MRSPAMLAVLATLCVVWTGVAPGEPLRLREVELRTGEPSPPVPGAWAASAAGRRFLVRLRARSRPELRRTLEALGAHILQTVPYRGHVVALDPGRAGAVRELPFVERVEPFHPWWRIAPELRRWVDAPAAPPDRMRVRAQAFAWGPVGKGRIAEAAQAAGSRVVATWPSGPVIELEVSRTELAAVARLDDTAWVEAWTAPGADMDLVREDTGAVTLESDLGACGQGVRGELLDFGVDETHQDLDGILLHGPNSPAGPPAGHGTRVAGILFSNGDRDGDGSAAATGMLPCAEQAISADIEFLVDRFAHTQELLSAPYFASFQSNSWGSAQTTAYTTRSFEVDDIVWRLDLPLLQSQSNTASQASRPEAWGKNVVSVGGVRHFDTLATGDDDWGNPPGDCPPANCASTGPAVDGRIKPDVAHWNDAIFTTDEAGSYVNFGGTSAATPVTAGVLGLVLQLWSDNVWGTDPVGSTVFEKRPHAATAKALLINSAEPYPFVGPAAPLARSRQGWGRPDAATARERAATSLVHDEETALEIDEWAGFLVDVAGGAPALRVTMVYTDPPGTTSAALHRINDLTLSVRSPSGVLYWGNGGLRDAVWSVPGGAPDTIDTVENVFVENPEPGDWYVRVGADEINQDAHLDTPGTDDAVFALVVTGADGEACVNTVADFELTPAVFQVGDPVEITSTVGGGSGSLSYAWDFDGDGVVDSTDANPSGVVYHAPYEGPIELRVLDAAGCPEYVTTPVVVEGPDLRVAGVQGTVEHTGNGNGYPDPGEVWELDLRVTNHGTVAATGVTASLAAAAANPGGLAVEEGTAAFGDIGPGGSAISTTPYRVRIGRGFPCGQGARFDVVASSLTPANDYPTEEQLVLLTVGGAGPPVPLWSDDFETETGWTIEGDPGEWDFAIPRGLGSPVPDPGTAYSGSRILGTDLVGGGAASGNYEDGITTTVVSPPIDTTGATGVRLRFARWLNVFSGDRATVSAGNDGGGDLGLFVAQTGFNEAAWAELDYDISAVADDRDDVRIRFGLETNAGLNQSGWNVDAVEIAGVTVESCSPLEVPVPGEVESLTVVAGEGGDVTLSWSADCGLGTGYSVYRGSLLAGYGSAAPLACDVAGTSLPVPAPGSAEFYFVTASDAFFEGGYGDAGDGSPRPELVGACRPRDSFASCP